MLSEQMVTEPKRTWVRFHDTTRKEVTVFLSLRLLRKQPALGGPSPQPLGYRTLFPFIFSSLVPSSSIHLLTLTVFSMSVLGTGRTTVNNTQLILMLMELTVYVEGDFNQRMRKTTASCAQRPGRKVHDRHSHPYSQSLKIILSFNPLLVFLIFLPLLVSFCFCHLLVSQSFPSYFCAFCFIPPFLCISTDHNLKVRKKCVIMIFFPY